MRYRREIDGLRALAVIPVVLFHAGFKTFQGGYIGVDVFFVISGYLITTIILGELRSEKFSLIQFYERRSRRIMPALFLIMTVSSIAAYFWMMPDEFKNFGQSLLATSIFSNNVLLAATSGYWDLTSEFKPLLHTWSLGVEEQYYIVFPFILLTLSTRSPKKLKITLVIGAVCSILLAQWGLISEPKFFAVKDAFTVNKSIATFYLLPTRAWEILLGAVTASLAEKIDVAPIKSWRNQCLSFLGLLMIVIPIFCFSQNFPSPGFFTLIPTIGSVLIIVYASCNTITNRLLSAKMMVGLGLISYSLYLWHQPIFAFSRIYLVEKPTGVLDAYLIILSLVLAYLTWKFIEKPFRNNEFIGVKIFSALFLLLSILFISFGWYLNKSYGMADRVFNPSVKVGDMDKRIYNERIFSYKKNSFEPTAKYKVLISGNSFARDFANIMIETFSMKDIDILYRDDIGECIFPFKSLDAQNIFKSADMIVFASGVYKKECINADLNFAINNNKHIYYVGTKHFGENLNWLIRLKKSDLPNQYNPIPKETIKEDLTMSSLIPKKNFISLLSPVIKDGQIPITNEHGVMLSTDRTHLTKYGAIFFGERVLLNSGFGKLFITNPN